MADFLTCDSPTMAGCGTSTRKVSTPSTAIRAPGTMNDMPQS